MGSERQVLLERLAEIEHQRWSDWQRWLHSVGRRTATGAIELPADRVATWERQIATPYGQLSEAEKAADRREVHRYLPLIDALPEVAGRRPMAESDRRLNVEGRLLEVVSRFGGQVIVSSEPMAAMVRMLADAAEALARDGFLPAVPRPANLAVPGAEGAPAGQDIEPVGPVN